MFEAVAKHIGELFFCVDLSRRRLHIVSNASKIDHHVCFVEDNVAAAGVFITRLPDASDIDNQFIASQRILVSAFVWSDELTSGCENSGEMGVAGKAETIYATEK